MAKYGISSSQNTHFYCKHEQSEPPNVASAVQMGQSGDASQLKVLRNPRSRNLDMEEER